MEMTPLCEIAMKYHTDKCPANRHDYTPKYFELLNGKQESLKKVLELGIGSYVTMRHVEEYQVGASLKMWKEFFPNAQIYGVDNDPSTMMNEERITTFLYDTTKESDMADLIATVGSDIDFVVDDGPHLTKKQIRTALFLLPRLKQDVLYVIEDTRNPELIREHLHEYDCELYIRAKEGAGDNNLVIVRKK